MIVLLSVDSALASQAQLGTDRKYLCLRGGCTCVYEVAGEAESSLTLVLFLLISTAYLQECSVD